MSMLKFMFRGFLFLCVCLAVAIAIALGFHSYDDWKKAQWTAPIPLELALSERTNYGSQRFEDRSCGAIIHRLTRSVTSSIRSDGLGVLPAGLRRDDDPPYGAWRATPMARDVFRKFIYDPERFVGAYCGGTWWKDWRNAALVAGNYYADNGESLILIRTRYADDLGGDNSHRVPTFYIGYFFNHERKRPPNGRDDG